MSTLMSTFFFENLALAAKARTVFDMGGTLHQSHFMKFQLREDPPGAYFEWILFTMMFYDPKKKNKVNK